MAAPGHRVVGTELGGWRKPSFPLPSYLYGKDTFMNRTHLVLFISIPVSKAELELSVEVSTELGSSWRYLWK